MLQGGDAEISLQGIAMHRHSFLTSEAERTHSNSIFGEAQGTRASKLTLQDSHLNKSNRMQKANCTLLLPGLVLSATHIDLANGAQDVASSPPLRRWPGNGDDGQIHHAAREHFQGWSCSPDKDSTPGCQPAAQGAGVNIGMAQPQLRGIEFYEGGLEKGASQN